MELSLYKEPSVKISGGMWIAMTVYLLCSQGERNNNITVEGVGVRHVVYKLTGHIRRLSLQSFSFFNVVQFYGFSGLARLKYGQYFSLQQRKADCAICSQTPAG